MVLLDFTNPGLFYNSIDLNSILFNSFLRFCDSDTHSPVACRGVMYVGVHRGRYDCLMDVRSHSVRTVLIHDIAAVMREETEISGKIGHAFFGVSTWSMMLLLSLLLMSLLLLLLLSLIENVMIFTTA